MHKRPLTVCPDIILPFLPSIHVFQKSNHPFPVPGRESRKLTNGREKEKKKKE